jgi:hypothetical protein
MSCGETYEVHHPEQAWLTRTTLYIGSDFDERGIPDDAAMCSLLHVTAVEPLNGQKRKKR